MTTVILSRDDLRTFTPSVFATTPWERMSESYRFIPTSKVLDMMTDQGFRVTSARQSLSRIEGKGDFTRHMLRLRHDSFVDGQGEVHEVVLVNSHDRSSAYRLFSGIFRRVCEYGMFVQAADFGNFSVRHSGSRALFLQHRGATSRIMDSVPTIMGRITDWKEIILPRRRQVEFAREAWPLKPNAAIPLVRLLTARRGEDLTMPDASRDLWKMTKVIQEALLRGAQTGRNERGRRATTQAVKVVDADIRVNRKLGEMAEKFSQN